MEINLSIDTIHTIHSSLRNSRHELKRQLAETDLPKEIIEYQLKDVEDALETFDALLNDYYDYKEYISSSTNGDYGPSNPWDAPRHEYI